jgi:hypothetical protein
MTTMNHTGDHDLTCDRLDELLPDHLEGTLAAAERAAVEAHAAGCARCASLLHDLQDIRTTAAALPTLRPSRDLWEGIAARIEAPVIELGPAAARGAAGARRSPRRDFRTAWLGAAAAALVAVTAGVTHQLTVRTMEQGPTPQVAVTPGPTAGTTAGTAPSGTTTDSVRPVAAPERLANAAPRPGAPASLSGGRGRGTAVTAVAVRRAAARESYDREIAALRGILGERRGGLSPSTVEILEQNLRIIDQAIEQSRAALARDPASVFLDQQLNSALEKKIELLRTAALLPTT